MSRRDEHVREDLPGELTLEQRFECLGGKSRTKVKASAKALQGLGKGERVKGDGPWERGQRGERAQGENRGATVQRGSDLSFNRMTLGSGWRWGVGQGRCGKAEVGTLVGKQL